MYISEFNNVSSLVFHGKKNETKYLKIPKDHIYKFFPILTKLYWWEIVRFGISLWELRMAVWVQLSEFCISL